MRILACVFAFALLSACGDSDRRGNADASAGDSTVPDGATQDSGVRPPGQLPPTTLDTSALLDQALAVCQRTISQYEGQIAARCNYDASLFDLIDTFAQAHADAQALGPIAGRNREAYAADPSMLMRTGTEVEIIPCTTDPLCMPGQPCSGMNAFALSDLVVALRPLLMAFTEGAAYWGQLAEAAGGVEFVDQNQLYNGLGMIYLAHSQGRPFSTVDSATAQQWLEQDEFVQEMWASVTAFLIFHEIAHAELNHSLINHTAAVGAQTVLMQEGRMLTPAEDAQLKAELRQLKVATEAQADIYAATLLQRAGTTSLGPVVLFTEAMSAFIVASGACDRTMTNDEFYDCALQAEPNASHPPLDVRAEILRRVIDEGEDLTELLHAFEM